MQNPASRKTQDFIVQAAIALHEAQDEGYEVILWQDLAKRLLPNWDMLSARTQKAYIADMKEMKSYIRDMAVETGRFPAVINKTLRHRRGKNAEQITTPARAVEVTKWGPHTPLVGFYINGQPLVFEADLSARRNLGHAIVGKFNGHERKALKAGYLLPAHVETFKVFNTGLREMTADNLGKKQDSMRRRFKKSA